MAHVVKAYMSGSLRREPHGHGASWTDYDGMRSVKLLGAEAEHEARCILAETEPASRPTCDHDPRRLPAFAARGQRARNIRHWTVRADVAWEAESALAEALATFVAMEIQ